MGPLISKANRGKVARARDVSALTAEFGLIGAQHHLSARGIDESEVAERGGTKSVSREVTLAEDTSDHDLILETLDKLGREVHEELTASRLPFKTVTVKVRYENFETHTH